MLHFESCKNVPERGGQAYGGDGLVEVEGRVMWGGGGGAYMLDDKDKWKRWTDDVEVGATLFLKASLLFKLHLSTLFFLTIFLASNSSTISSVIQPDGLAAPLLPFGPLGTN